MNKYIILALNIFFFSCINQQNKNSHYTQKQIDTLHLDSTTILSAKTDSLIKVDLNPFLKIQHFDFGSLVNKIKLIPLETTDESLVDNIYKVIVSDSNIYIMDGFKGQGIVIFDIEGKFVKRVPSGQGPGELARLYDIAYDTETHEFIAYTHSFLLFFTSSGQFIRQIRLPFGFYNFAVIPDGYVFKTIDKQGNGHLGILEDYTLFITDKNFKLKSVGVFCHPQGHVLGGYNYLYNNNDVITVTHGYTDTIYQYISKSNRLNAKYIMDYSRKKLPERYLQCDTWNEFKKATTQNDYYFYIGEYLGTNSLDVFFLYNGQIGKTIIYRNTKSGNLVGGTHADYDTNEIPSIGFPKAASGNNLIDWYLPSENNAILSNSSIISEEDKKKIKGLKDDDNPVLVFFQLKEF